MGRVGRFLTRVGAVCISYAVTLAMLLAAGSGVSDAAADDARAASGYVGHDVYASLSADGTMSGGVYVMDPGTTQDAGSGSSGASGSSENTSATGVRRMAVGDEALPWTVRVTYSLDGPEVDADTVNGASGLVGVRVDVIRNDIASADVRAAASRLVPMIAFTVPGDIADDLTASDGATVARDGSSIVVAAIGDDTVLTYDDNDDAGDDVAKALTGGSQSGTDDTVLSVSAYLNATRFSMSAIILSAVPAADAASFAAQHNKLTAGATSLTDTLTGAGDQRNDDLINELTALRDRERALADTTIAERDKAHRQAFDAYMAAYVGSYTTHLSGSIGNTTQMAALIGTAGELTGDTPLAQAVVDLANAVNAVSAAHRHTGAADEVDAIIRRIRQQGVAGLTGELEQEAGHESQLGSSGYSAGQSQLSQAMIPYSMAYTDTYTEHLSELTGGTTTGALAYQAQAIAQTNESFSTDADLKADQAKVDAAMAALATASEHTGRAQAIRQLLLRFEDEFENGDEDAAADAETGGGSVRATTALQSALAVADADSGTGTDVSAQVMTSGGIAAVSERARLERLHAARERAAATVRRKTQNGDRSASLVDDQVSMSKSDVMSYAGGVAALGGSAGSGSSGGSNNGTQRADGSSSGSDHTRNDTATSDSSSTNGDGNTSASVPDEQPSVAYGIRGMSSGSMLTPDTSAIIDDTVAIGDTADILTSATAALADAGALTDLASRHTVQTDDQTTRFLLVYSM